MHYITLDTNTWIYLANGTEPVKILRFIKKEIDKNNITILLPQTIIDEWNTHKIKTVKKGTLKHFDEVEKALNRIEKLIGGAGKANPLNFLLDNNSNKEDFTDFYKKFKTKNVEIIKAVNNNIDLIEKLFENQNTIKIKINDNVKLKAGQFALEKKAPFKNKNSFADAIILFSFFDYIKVNSIKDAIFISYNTDDFCQKANNKKTLHPDLKPGFLETQSKYYSIVGEAINTIEKNIISQEELEWIKEQQQFTEEEQMVFCEICSEMNNRTNVVSFNNSFTLYDERKQLMYDPNQLELEFAEKMPKSKFKPKEESINVGFCDWCNSAHFECVECGTINPIWENEYDEEKECEGCGLIYIATIDKKTDSLHEIDTIVIPKNKGFCIKCNDEYEITDLNKGICPYCEDK